MASLHAFETRHVELSDATSNPGYSVYSFHGRLELTEVSPIQRPGLVSKKQYGNANHLVHRPLRSDAEPVFHEHRMRQSTKNERCQTITGSHFLIQGKVWGDDRAKVRELLSDWKFSVIDIYAWSVTLLECMLGELLSLRQFHALSSSSVMWVEATYDTLKLRNTPRSWFESPQDEQSATVVSIAYWNPISSSWVSMIQMKLCGDKQVEKYRGQCTTLLHAFKNAEWVQPLASCRDWGIHSIMKRLNHTNKLSGHPNFLRCFRNSSLSTMSKAFDRSTNTAKRSLCCSLFFSRSSRSTKVTSVVDLSFWKPHCDSGKTLPDTCSTSLIRSSFA